MYSFTLLQDGGACSLHELRYKILELFRTEGGDRVLSGKQSYCHLCPFSSRFNEKVVDSHGGLWSSRPRRGEEE